MQGSRKILCYGYMVKHGGVSRYIYEQARIEKTPILALEHDGSYPDVNVHLVQCDRDPTFLSPTENESFSEQVSLIQQKGIRIHSHGVYNITPDFYTAHISIQGYCKALIDNNIKVPENYKKLAEIESRMISNMDPMRVHPVSLKVAEDLGIKHNLFAPGASRLEEKHKIRNFRKPLQIGIIGSNAQAKGINHMMEAARNLPAGFAKINVFGGGDDLSSFLERYSDVPYKNHKRIDMTEETFDNLDILCVLSVYEAYSLSTLEAFSQGVPVISSNANGVFLRFKDNLLSRVDNSRDIDAITRTILKISNDKNYRNDVIDSQYKINRLHSWKTTSW